MVGTPMSGPSEFPLITQKGYVVVVLRRAGDLASIDLESAVRAGAHHGNTTTLCAAQRDDLVAYLESL
jgi:hypothetical protein